jgi:hypothetical protein
MIDDDNDAFGDDDDDDGPCIAAPRTKVSIMGLTASTFQPSASSATRTRNFGVAGVTNRSANFIRNVRTAVTQSIRHLGIPRSGIRATDKKFRYDAFLNLTSGISAVSSILFYKATCRETTARRQRGVTCPLGSTVR